MTSLSPATPRASDRWIPWAFFAFFVVLILTLVPMGLVAVRTNTGVSTEHAYEKGLAYNKTLKAAAQQAALNWRGDLTVAPSAEGVRVDFRLLDAVGKPLDRAEVALWLVRPTQDGMDRRSDMQALADGHYTANLALPARGLWEARVSAMVNGQNYQTVKRVVLP